jgi:pheromone shutdown protein TraB
MLRLHTCLLIFAFALLGNAAWAQIENDTLVSFNEKRIQISRVGMTALGSWAIGNFLVSGFLIGRTDGSTKAFHQMNVGWNLINLGLAGFGYYNALKANPAALDLYQTIKEQYGLEKTFLFNGGLDVGYVLGGLYLTERARNASKNQDMLKGFGQSIMLQGGFLLVFDLAMFFIVNHHGQLLQPLLNNVTFTGSLSGIGVIIHL